jgi:hypothetical protein
MKKAPYNLPVAVRAGAVDKAFSLVNQGYVQACETMKCSMCSAKYLFLCDPIDSGRRKSITGKHTEALAYFMEKVCEAHQGGHIEDVLVWTSELLSISVEPIIIELPDVPGRKVG